MRKSRDSWLLLAMVSAGSRCGRPSRHARTTFVAGCRLALSAGLDCLPPAFTLLFSVLLNRLSVCLGLAFVKQTDVHANWLQADVGFFPVLFDPLVDVALREDVRGAGSIGGSGSGHWRAERSAVYFVGRLHVWVTGRLEVVNLLQMLQAL